MGGGGESAEAVFRAMKSLPRRTRSRAPRRDAVPHRESHRFAVQQPDPECWPRWSSRVSTSSARRGMSRCATFLAAGCATVFRSRRIASTAYANPATGDGEVRTLDQILANARDLKQRYGFTTHKMKAGVFHPDHEVELYRALAANFSRRQSAVRLQCDLVDRTGHPLRPADRRPEQRLPGRSGLWA